MEFELPENDQKALAAICREQLRSGGWYEREARVEVEADCLRRLRDCQLVRIGATDRVGGTTTGWARAYPECVKEAVQLLETIRLAVLERRVPQNFSIRSKPWAALLSSIAPWHELEIEGDRIQVTASLRNFRAEEWIRQPTALPVVAVPTLWGYGVRNFNRLVRQPGGGRPLDAGPYVEACFVDCDFRGARLTGVVFENCEFHRSWFDGCEFSGGSVRYCSFFGGSFVPSSVNALEVEGTRFLGGCRVDAAALSRSGRFDHFEVNGRVVARTRVVILRRPLTWEVFFDGEPLGPVELMYVLPLHLLVGFPGVEVSTMDLAIASECAEVPSLGEALDKDEGYRRVQIDDCITKQILSDVLSGLGGLDGVRISKLWSDLKVGSDNRRRLACCIRGYIAANAFEQLAGAASSLHRTYIPGKKSIAGVINQALLNRKLGSLNTSVPQLGRMGQGLRSLWSEGPLTRHAALVAHLERSLTTGEICCYRPPGE